MATWPRTITPLRTQRPRFMRPLRRRSQRGGVQTRHPLQAGITWSETYPLLKAGRANDEDLMAFMDEIRERGLTFDIDHLLLPGSGKAPRGTGTAGITVDGAGQTGNTLATTGWPTTQSGVVKKGDWLAVAGLPWRIKATADADSNGAGDATISFIPAIWSGQSPADAAAVTTTGVTFVCTLAPGGTELEANRPPDFWGGVTMVFEEAL